MEDCKPHTCVNVLEYAHVLQIMELYTCMHINSVLHSNTLLLQPVTPKLLMELCVRLADLEAMNTWNVVSACCIILHVAAELL